MNDELRNLIQVFWERAGTSPFSDEALFDRLSIDGGFDAKDLTVPIVTAVLDQHLITSWSTATFACSELVAFYLALLRLAQ